jgi:hypothetical protein
MKMKCYLPHRNLFLGPLVPHVFSIFDHVANLTTSKTSHLSIFVNCLKVMTFTLNISNKLKTLIYDTMNIQKVLCFPTKFDGDILFELPPKWPNVTTPLLEECEDDIHTPKMGTWESSRTPKISEFDCRGQNTSLWSVLQVVGNLLKCRCRKWPRMNHLDICSTSYGKKKGWESN